MREANNLPQPSFVDLDPEDPAQLLDDADQYSISNVDLDAQPAAEADAELDAAVADSAGEDGPYPGSVDDVEAEAAAAQGGDVDDEARELETQTTADEYTETADDTGDLYGVHVPPAGDTDFDLTPDGESYREAELGEHAFETLEKKMAEGGPAPDADTEFVDDSDPESGHSKSDRRDRPIADRGSGGPGGL